MPFRARRPMGGFRVMYEYANRLSDLGYKVHITYPIKTKYMKYRLPYWIRLTLSYITGFRSDEWFKFREGITRSYVKYVDENFIIDADIVIATWWSTVADVGLLSERKGKKINLIQGYENWEGHEDLLHLTYDINGITNVVVASYLEKIVSQYTNNRIVLIPNSIDNKAGFFVKETIKDRTPETVCMLYSTQEIKGSKYGLEALSIVKKKHPELRVELFGICPEPDNLPDWIKFYRNPNDLCALYNRSAIFISNSLTEGFGLVSVEAMACGCALVCTDIAGHIEYAFHEDTAMLVETKNPKQMSDQISSLIENVERRIELAERGNKYVQRFSWDVAVGKMDSLIKDLMRA